MGIGTNHVADGLRPHLLAGKALSTGSRRGSARCSCILLGVLKEMFLLANGTIFENGLKLERFRECFFACAWPEGGHRTM